MKKKACDWVSLDLRLLRALVHPVSCSELSVSGFGLYSAVVRSVKKHERLGLVVVSEARLNAKGAPTKNWVLNDRGMMVLAIFGGKV